MNDFKKTNAVRIVEAAGIPYRTASYEYDEANSGAEAAAEKLSIKPEIIFKTIVTHSEDNRIFVFCIPGNRHLNQKKAAKVTGSNKIDLVGEKDLFPRTGYIRGGCSPIGMKKTFSTYIDESAVPLEKIYINAGMRGLQMIMSPRDLARLCEAEFVNIV